MSTLPPHRRRGPRISSPARSPLTPHAEEKRPNGSRSICSPSPIWLVVILLVTIAFVHNFLPSRTPTPLPSYASTNLSPVNYFNASAPTLNPFSFCSKHNSDDSTLTKYGVPSLSSTLIHPGSSHRIQRVLNRVLAGQSVTISIIGGSISACHGAGDDPISPKCFPSKFFDWWNTIFPHPATELSNGAMRLTTSDYFGFCSGHHLPDVTDLVIVELDSDDSSGEDQAQKFEFLIRSLLTRPDQPAVLLLGHFSPQVYRTYRYTGPDHWHGIVAKFYDVPYLSTKAFLLNDYIQDEKKISKYYADPVLANSQGHTLLADVLISYIRSIICETWDMATGANAQTDKLKDSPGLLGGIGLRKGVPEPGAEQNGADGERSNQELNKKSDPRLKVPSSLMFSPPTDKPFVDISPYCVSANDLINPLPSSLFYGSGWSAYHPSPSLSNQKAEGGATAAHYFHSTLPHSQLRIPIIVSHGDVGIYYLKEGKDKLVDGGSEIECWVDDNYAGRKVLSNVFAGNGVHATLTMIDRSVAKGSHYVDCQLMGDEERGVPVFKIVGVFAN